MTTSLVRKSALLKGILAILILGALTVSSQAQLKIGTVDLQKVFEGYYKKRQADALLQDTGADADKEIKRMEDDYKKFNEEYRKLIEGANDQAVSADEREKRKKTAEAKLLEIKELEKNFLQFKRQAETSIGEQKKRYQEKIIQDIREVVSKKAQAGSFTMVFDTGTRVDVPFLLYTNGQNDLTDEVLTELNATAPAGTLTTGANKEEKPSVLPKPTDPDLKPGGNSAKPGKPPKKP